MQHHRATTAGTSSVQDKSIDGGVWSCFHKRHRATIIETGDDGDESADGGSWTRLRKCHPAEGGNTFSTLDRRLAKRQGYSDLFDVRESLKIARLASRWAMIQ